MLFRRYASFLGYKQISNQTAYFTKRFIDFHRYALQFIEKSSAMWYNVVKLHYGANNAITNRQHKQKLRRQKGT